MAKKARNPRGKPN